MCYSVAKKKKKKSELGDRFRDATSLCLTVASNGKNVNPGRPLPARGGLSWVNKDNM